MSNFLPPFTQILATACQTSSSSEQCCPDDVQILTNADLAVADNPTQADVDSYVTANGPFNSGTPLVYSSTSGARWSWVISKTGAAVLISSGVAPSTSGLADASQDGLYSSREFNTQTLPTLGGAGDWDAALGYLGTISSATLNNLSDVDNLPLGRTLFVDFVKTASSGGITLATPLNFDATSLSHTSGLNSSPEGVYRVEITRTATGTGGGELRLRVSRPVKPAVENLGSVSGAVTVPFDSSSAYLTATGDITPTFATSPRGTERILEFIQDATGSRTITWPANVKFQGSSPQPFAAGTTVFSFYSDGTNYHG